MKSSSKNHQIILFLICISILITSSTTPVSMGKEALPCPQETPSLPSDNPNDYILGLYSMFSTDNYALLNKMVSSEGTQFHFPYGVGFFNKGENNTNEVKSEFQKASGLDQAQCIGVDTASHGKFTVFFKGIQFEGFDKDTTTFFLFMKNEQDSWDFLLIGYMPDYMEGSGLGDLDACPVNPFRLSEEQENSAGTAHSVNSFTDYPPDNKEQTEEKKKKSIFSRLVKQVYAQGCTHRRNKIDDKNDDFVQCVEYVQEIREDALCWLDYEAYAYKWDDYAIKYGADLVSVGNEPIIGDIVVWNKECGGDFSSNGHVAIVTNVSENTTGQIFIDVDEANGDFTGTIGSRTDIPVNDCMKFIHEPGVNETSEKSSNQAIEDKEDKIEISANKKTSWWQSLLCFLNPWCD